MIAAGLHLVRRLGQINWGLADQVVVSGGNFLTTLLLARSLGVEEFGRFTLAWMVVLFAGHLQQALILAPMMSIGPKEQARAPAFFGAILLLQLLFVGLTTAVLIAGIGLVEAIWPDYRLSALALPLRVANGSHQAHEFLRRYFFTVRRPEISLSIGALRYLGQAALLAWALRSFEIGTATALWTATLAGLAASAVGASLVRDLAWSTDSFRLTLVRTWGFSQWLVRAYAMGWLAGNVFQFAAGALLGPAAVGMIKAAQTLMGLVQLVYFGISGVAPAEASRAFVASGTIGLSRYLRRVAGAGVAISCAVTLLLLVAPQFWLDLLFGAGYETQRSIIFWLGVVQALLFVEFPASIGLRTLQRTYPIWQATRLAGAYAILVAYPAVAILGLHGVVLGWTGSMLLKVVVTWRGFRAATSQNTEP
jgi:O-antigen/teichoic acid export membrane protein